ncbi:MAG: hydrogenase [Thermofilum sp. ex4484_15]|nr:MAG: hydrogenase [Thermofilum sp. ex4484_15]
MCLGVPGRIVELKEGFRALVDFGGIRREVDVSLLPGVKVGDYVIIHAGAAISKVSEEDALITLKLWKEIAEVMGYGKRGSSNISSR